MKLLENETNKEDRQKRCIKKGGKANEEGRQKFGVDRL